MKAIYLIYSSLNIERPDGIEKKILNQVKMFEDVGIKTSFYTLTKKNGTFWNYSSEIADTDFIYFRKSTIVDYRFLHFFKKVKAKNPRSAIFMEIPTYPYEGEYRKSLKARLSLIIDHFFRKKIHKYIDRVVVTGANVGKTIWGIKAINVVNGIDLERVLKRDISKQSNEKDKIVISCIAKFSPWHGYERLIKGLYSYYSNGGTQNICLLMVGDGPEKEYYEKLVQEKHLCHHVTFTGQLIGDELNEIYEKTDIGCCSLGRYKSGINVIGDLKSREFMAQGIPMILGCKIDVLDGIDYPYAVEFPNDETEIDIEKIVRFYYSLKKRGINHITSQIRRYAVELVDLRKCYKSVIDELQSMQTLSE